MRIARTILRNKRWSGIAAFFLISATAASAAWLINSHGRGATKIGSLTAPTVTASSPAPPDLYPGGDGPGTFTIDNNNPMALKVISAQIGDVQDAVTSNPNCPVQFLSVNPKVNLDIDVPKGVSQVTVPDLYHLAGDAPSDCMGVTLSRDISLRFSTPGQGA
jgi:hypothetical protein